jgi:hypothetical protein
MSVLKRIVFFWIGEDVTVPTVLVASIRRHMQSGLEVIQLSDTTTPRVPGTTAAHALKLSSSIMIARLEAYASLRVAEPTLYLDADMLVLRPFDLPQLAAGEIGITRRPPRDDGLIHESGDTPVYPEFRGKTLGEVMPYIYSFVYTSSEMLFVRQLELLRASSAPLQAWFGDQVTLKQVLDDGAFLEREFDADKYNCTVRTVAEYDRLSASADPPYIAHFKGAQAKQTLLEIAARGDSRAPPRRALRWWPWRKP